MALGSTQLLTENARSISWGGKGSRYVRLTTLPPSCAVVTKSGDLNFLEPSGPVTGLLYLYLYHAHWLMLIVIPTYAHTSNVNSY